MDRLTDKRFVGDGFYQPKNHEERLEIFANVPKLRDIYNRLAEYEDTGLTPDEINAKNKPAHWYINPDGYYPQCSNCGYEPPRELIRRNGDALIFPRYCPECGSDTKREVK